MAFLSEAAVEQALLDQLRALDYSIEREEDIGPDGHRPERESHDEVVLKKRFGDAVARLLAAAGPILSLDIGSGTQDVLLALPGERAENWPRFVLPSPALGIADRIRRHGVPAVQITTGVTCHLDAVMIHDALHVLDLDHRLPLRRLRAALQVHRAAHVITSDCAGCQQA